MWDSGAAMILRGLCVYWGVGEVCVGFRAPVKCLSILGTGVCMCVWEVFVAFRAAMKLVCMCLWTNDVCVRACVRVCVGYGAPMRLPLGCLDGQGVLGDRGWDSVGSHLTMSGPPETVRTATPFPMVSLFLVFTAFVISNIGHIRPQRTILAFISGIFFILSGEGAGRGLRAFLRGMSY